MAIIGSKDSKKCTGDDIVLEASLSSTIHQKSPYMPPIRLRRRNALDQRIASLTRKTWPSVASNYQADFYSQGIKRPAYMPPAFDGLYFLRMYPSYLG